MLQQCGVDVQLDPKKALRQQLYHDFGLPMEEENSDDDSIISQSSSASWSTISDSDSDDESYMQGQSVNSSHSQLTKE